MAELDRDGWKKVVARGSRGDKSIKSSEWMYGTRLELGQAELKYSLADRHHIAVGHVPLQNP